MNDSDSTSSDFFVYLLVSQDERYTYVGATVDIDRRLRQHNGEIKGGAKATTRKGKDAWRRACYVSGFPTWQAALQFEWRWKHLTRQQSLQHPLDRRKAALERLLSLDRPTSKAVPYALWPKGAPEVHWEDLHGDDLG